MKITHKKLRGEEDTVVFSVRLKKELAEELDNLVRETNRSRNNLIEVLLYAGIKWAKQKENENDD